MKSIESMSLRSLFKSAAERGISRPAKEIPEEKVTDVIAQVASNPLEQSTFLTQELEHLSEIKQATVETKLAKAEKAKQERDLEAARKLFNEAKKESEKTVEDLALEEAERSANAGNVKVTKELLYVGTQDLVERFDILQKAHENNVILTMEENTRKVSYAQTELDIFQAAREEFLQEVIGEDPHQEAPLPINREIYITPFEAAGED